MITTKPAGDILAGGRSSRMGGLSKALSPLNDEALLTHVIRRVQPQLGTLLLSTESGGNHLDSFGLDVKSFAVLGRHVGPPVPR